jgi:hypothetical protein
MGIIVKKKSTLILLAILTVGIWVQSSNALPSSTANYNYILTGNNLLEYCESTKATRRIICTSYLMGVLDGHGYITLPPMEPLHCVPTGVNPNQLKLVVIKFLKSHPEFLHGGAPELITLAFMKHFPCSKNFKP